MTDNNRIFRFSLMSLLAMVACFVLGFVARDLADSLLRTRVPSSTAELKPGEQLIVESLADRTLNRRVTVMSDSTVDLPVLGIVSVANSAVKDVEKDLNKQYAQFYRTPMIRVSRATISEPLDNQVQ